MKNNDWEREIEYCKKLNKSNPIKRNNSLITERLFEKLKMKSEIMDEDIAIPIIDDYFYKVKKNESLGIDRNTDKKLKSGKIDIDMTIDFHGCTLNEAFGLLKNSINNAYSKDFKYLLLITGKGRGTPEGRESIKSSIENWMQDPDISSKITKYVDAKDKDGGSGALYVKMKNKNKYRI
jgi:DNA-nicking Smr family endonuclease